MKVGWHAAKRLCQATLGIVGWSVGTVGPKGHWAANRQAAPMLPWQATKRCCQARCPDAT